MAMLADGLDRGEGHRPVGTAPVSEFAKTLDGAVAAFHAHPHTNADTALMLGGVLLAPKTGVGTIRRPALVAPGVRPDGNKEVIDLRLAVAESEAAWEGFLTDLLSRGLTGVGLEMICADGGPGLLPT